MGRLLSGTPEYRYMEASERDLSEDTDTTALLDELAKLNEALMEKASRGETPSEEETREFYDLRGQVQSKTNYQAFISAQANMEKLMDRVNQAIARGIRTGLESKIIVPASDVIANAEPESRIIIP